MSLKKNFEEAAGKATNLPERPSNDILLKLYAYYKQGLFGNVTGARPGLAEFKSRVKYDAWKR